MSSLVENHLLNEQEEINSETKSETDASNEHHNRITMEMNAQQSIDRRNQEFLDRNLCPSCFLTRVYCLCNYNRQLFAPIRDRIAPEYKLNIKFHLYMHYKEWGRASNTGKLLTVGLPNQTSMKIYGITVDEAELAEELLNNPSIILYPKKDSVSITEFQEVLNQINQGTYQNPNQSHKDHSKTNLESFSAEQSFHICIIDSTWSQSICMERHLPPSIPRVHLNEFVNQPSKFLNRKQSKNKTKISTIESITLALGALQVSPEILDIFHKSLEYSVDTLLRQCSKKPVYGNIITPNITSFLEGKKQQQLQSGAVEETLDNKDERSEPVTEASLKARGETLYCGPITIPAIEKPTVCLQCGYAVTGNSFSFKNCGLRSRRRDLAAGVALTEEKRLEQESRIDAIVRDMNPADFSSQAAYEANLAEIKEILRHEVVYRMWKCPKCSKYFPTREEALPVPSTTSTTSVEHASDV